MIPLENSSEIPDLLLQPLHMKKPEKTRVPTVPNSKGTGRPTIRTPELAALICEKMTEGETLTAICKNAGVSVRAVDEWLNEDASFALSYERARARRAEKYAQETTEIADEPPRMIVDPDSGIERVDSGWVTWQKNRVDARKWIASKLLPRVYGDKLEVDQKTTVEAGPSLLELAERVRGASPLLERRKRERGQVVDVEPGLLPEE